MPQGTAWRCEDGHTFDVARAGYVNLLQPQDRRAALPGDPADAVAAREWLLARGIGVEALEGVVREARAWLRDGDGVVAELGSGTGELLAKVVASIDGVDAVGLELSSAAIVRATRRCPAATWIVANADRRLPLADGSVDVVLSMHARRNPSECARILRAGGGLIVVVPAPDDLIELRAAIGGAAVQRSRVDGVLREHAGLFVPVAAARLEERHRLDPVALTALLRATYRGARQREARVAALADLDVTLASDLLTFRRR